MKIALTGATGFLGRYILRQLVESGHTLRCWYRPASDRSGLDRWEPYIEWVAGDLADPDAADAVLDGCDAVVHSALWRPGATFQGQEGDLVTFAQYNVVGTLRLMAGAVRRRMARFVFISTCAVHDRILDDRPLDEAHPLWPQSHYGAHKAALEKFVHSYGYGEGFPICSLRPTGIYGVAHPVQQSKWYGLVRRVALGETVQCRRGGKEVHAADVAKAVELLLSTGEVAGESFNCYDRYVSEWDVATIAQRLAGSHGEIEGGPTAPQHQIETSKLRRLGMVFGGTPRLEETIRQMLTGIA